MSAHRNANNIKELRTYFDCVIDWVSTVFTDVESEMRGLEWGRLYEQYHSKSYNRAKVSRRSSGYSAIRTSRIGGASSNTFSEAFDTRSYWMYGCSTKRPSSPCTPRRPKLPKPRANQIVRSAQSATLPIRARYGNSPK